MEKRVTRLTALLLAVAMSFSLLSTSAWATELPVEETEPAETVEETETFPEEASVADGTEEETEVPPEEESVSEETEELEVLPEEEPVSEETEESEALPETEALPEEVPVVSEEISTQEGAVAEKPVEAEVQTITGFHENMVIQSVFMSEKEKLSQTSLVNRLPTAISVYLNGSDSASKLAVTWECVSGDYDRTSSTYYQFVPKWDETSYALDAALAGTDCIPYAEVLISFAIEEDLGQEPTTQGLDCSLNAVVNAALQILYVNEGSYGSINKNDNGAVSVGKIQWHGNRALNLLKTIVNDMGSSAQSILGTTLYNEIRTSSSWSNRIVSAGEASALASLLTTSAGKSAQDALAKSDVTTYANHGVGLGLSHGNAVVYFADLENQGGYGMSSRVAGSAASRAGSYNGVTLDIIHSAALADSVAGRYATRRNQTYSYCKNLNINSTSNSPPEGTTDAAIGGKGTIYVRGWTFDRDNLSAALGVHVYVGGPVGSGAPGYAITANTYRPDVNTAFPGVGAYHGFDATISVALRGTQTVYLYALDVNGGTNPLIGTKTVTISEKPSPPILSRLTITNVSASGYTITCQAEGEAGINRVQFATWTDKNGQDDLNGAWLTDAACSGTKSGNTYTYRVNTKDHNGESGLYCTDIYTYDEIGQYDKLAIQCYIRTGSSYGASERKRTTYGGHTYVILDKELYWWGASAYCQSIGGHLAVITSQAENDAVAAIISEYGESCWIGGADYDHSRSFRWITGEPMNYTHWQAGEPNNDGGDQYYMQMYTNSNWDDVNNSTAMAFVCEFDTLSTVSANTITASNFTKVSSATVNQSFSIGATAKDGAKLFYRSNSSSVTVSSTGKVTIKKGFIGVATITITAAATSKYKATTKRIAVTVKLATPTLTAVTNVTTGVVVRWSRVSNAVGYHVCRKTSTSNWVRIATIKNANTVIYGDTAVKSQNGIAYTYTVRAYSSGALSDYNKTGKTVVRLTTSAAPSVSPSGSKQMTVKWGKKANATGYQIEYADNGSFSGYQLTTVSGATTVSKAITNLTEGKTYYVRIRTYKTYNKANYYSDWSGVRSVNIPLSTPAISKLSNSGSKKMTVKWGENASATGYQIQYATNSSFRGYKLVTVKGSATVSTVIAKLTKKKTYYVRVRSYKTYNNVNHYSAWSKTKHVKIRK